MATYKITDPESGKTLQLTGESPPTEEEIEEIFSTFRQQSPDGHKADKTDSLSRPDGNAPISREKTRQIMAEAGTDTQPAETTPDVLLDIPTLKVDEIKLNVEDLEARVALSAQLANLVRLDVGAHVSIAKVDLDIRGVEAQALLKVRLKHVHDILARALQTIESNPEVLRSVLAPVGQAVNELGKGTGAAVGDIGRGTGQAVGELGTGTARSLEPGGPLGETVRETTSDTGEVAKGVTAEKGPVSESIRDTGKGLNESIHGEYKDTEQERRHLHREDKEPVRS